MLGDGKRERAVSAGNRMVARWRAMFLGNRDVSDVMRGAGLVLTIQFVSIGLGFLSYVFFARWLGAFEFGIYVYCIGWATLLSVAAQVGLRTAALRFVPGYLAKEHYPRLAGFLRFAPVTVLGTGLTIGLAGIALVLAGDWFAGHYRVPLSIALVMVPFFALIRVNAGVARGFGRVAVAFVPRTAARALPLPVAAVLLLGFGVDLDAASVLLIAVVCALLSLVVQQRLITTGLPETVRAAPRSYEGGLWLQVAFPLWLIAGCAAVLGQTSILMVGAFMGPDEVGVYSAAARTATLVTLILFSVNALAGPRIARLHALGKMDELQALVSGVSLWIFWPSLVAVLILVFFGDRVLGLFGPGFAAAHGALAVLAFGQLVNAATGPVGLLLNLTGHHIVSFWVYLSFAVAGVVLNAALIPPFGIMGAAVAIAVTVGCLNLALVVVARRRLGINSLVFARRQARHNP